MDLEIVHLPVKAKKRCFSRLHSYKEVEHHTIAKRSAGAVTCAVRALLISMPYHAIYLYRDEQ